MFTFRCTRKLLDRLKTKPEATPAAPTTVLGDWYANHLIIHRQHLVLCCAERTFLPVLLPTGELASLIPRLRAELGDLLAAIGVPRHASDLELAAMADHAVAKTASRTVLGVMNEYGLALEQARRGERLQDLSLWLAKTPVGPLRMESPARASLAAFANASPNLDVSPIRAPSAHSSPAAKSARRRSGEKTRPGPAANAPAARACELCGKRGNARQTDCCGRFICDDEENYVPLSYARNSCDRNHRRYTLCGFHFAEDHEGHWQGCQACRRQFETEMYVYYGTNEHNFEKLKDGVAARGSASRSESSAKLPAASPGFKRRKQNNGNLLILVAGARAGQG